MKTKNFISDKKVCTKNSNNFLSKILLFIILTLFSLQISYSCDDIIYEVSYLEKDEIGCFSDIQIYFEKENCSTECFSEFNYFKVFTDGDILSEYNLKKPERISNPFILFKKNLSCDNGIFYEFKAEFDGDKQCMFSFIFEEEYVEYLENVEIQKQEEQEELKRLDELRELEELENEILITYNDSSLYEEILNSENIIINIKPISNFNKTNNVAVQISSIEHVSDLMLKVNESNSKNNGSSFSFSTIYLISFIIIILLLLIIIYFTLKNSNKSNKKK